jgi:O-methyltransferase
MDLYSHLQFIPNSDNAAMNNRDCQMNENELRLMYIDLIKRCLVNTIYFQPYQGISSEVRAEGQDWPIDAHTMIGMKRLNNIQLCVESVLEDKVPGDLMETGVWKGGATIFMRALLKAYGVVDRLVWVADSFEGLPEPDVVNYPQDDGIDLYKFPELSISIEEVRDNFLRYDLLDKQVKWIKGWFKETLPQAPVEKLAVLRLDGDLYESTIIALDSLYPKLVQGGYLIVDDYGCIEACREAVHDYREKHKISEEIVSVDWTGVYWRKT